MTRAPAERHPYTSSFVDLAKMDRLNGMTLEGQMEVSK